MATRRPHIKLGPAVNIPINAQNPMTTTRARNMVSALCNIGVLSMNAYKFRKRLELNVQFKLVLVNNLEHDED